MKFCEPELPACQKVSQPKCFARLTFGKRQDCRRGSDRRAIGLEDEDALLVAEAICEVIGKDTAADAGAHDDDIEVVARPM